MGVRDSLRMNMAEGKLEQVQAEEAEVTQEQEPSLLDKIITETRIGRD